MSVEKKDFYGKEVTDAIKSACENLGVSQEMLDIEVLETGSTGIFGLIRKKAKIRVSLKGKLEPKIIEEVVETVPVPEPAVVEEVKEEISVEEPVVKPASEPVKEAEVKETVPADNAIAESSSEAEEVDASPESLEIVKSEVEQLVTLMGFPSDVQVAAEGLSITCDIKGEHEEALAGPEGKTLDSIQYLARKMVARKCAERLRIAINVGNFREQRLEQLKERAIELAGKVKETGKTHVLPALNPSERREIHMVLQEDKDVRSRSVGDGLFKKILIYKPGKGNRGGRRKSPPRGRRGKNNRNSNSSNEE